MRDSFVFYSSFAQAANMLGDKARLKLYDAVVKLGLCCAENVTELEQTCAEIESKLVQNRNAFAQFLLIKPQIIANFTRYINGSKGSKFGALGGAPKGNKNATKNNPKTTPNENVNVNDNNIKKENKKKKNYSDDFEKWWAEYPRKVSKLDAQKSFEKIIAGNNVTFDALLNGVKRYAWHCKVQNTEEQYIKHPATWLNQGCWADVFNDPPTDEELASWKYKPENPETETDWEFWRTMNEGEENV